jgi:2'-5' RNA ligase
MASYINICFDEISAAKVESLQRRLSQRSITDCAERLGYAPHITLLRYDEGSLDEMIEAARGFREQAASLASAICSLSLFGGASPVLWLGLVPNAPLYEFHRALHGKLPDLNVHSHYAPENWVPHVTLAADLDQSSAAAAVDATLPIFGPFTANPDRIEIVTFPPIEIVWSAQTASHIPDRIL